MKTRDSQWEARVLKSLPSRGTHQGDLLSWLEENPRPRRVSQIRSDFDPSRSYGSIASMVSILFKRGAIERRPTKMGKKNKITHEYRGISKGAQPRQTFLTPEDKPDIGALVEALEDKDTQRFLQSLICGELHELRYIIIHLWMRDDRREILEACLETTLLKAKYTAALQRLKDGLTEKT